MMVLGVNCHLYLFLHKCAELVDASRFHLTRKLVWIKMTILVGRVERSIWCVCVCVSVCLDNNLWTSDLWSRHLEWHCLRQVRMSRW